MSLQPITISNLKQTKASKGIRCDRFSILGNPFVMRTPSDRMPVIKAFRKYFWLVLQEMEPVNAAKQVEQETGLLLAHSWKKTSRENFLKELFRVYAIVKQKPCTLLCWCAPESCHLEVLVKFFEWCDREALTIEKFLR